MLINFCAFIFFCSGIALAAEPVASCPQGQYLVKAHHRSAYVRTDGTQVKASSVKAYCKMHSQSSLYATDRLKNELPHGWQELKQKNQLDYGHATGWRYNIENDNKIYLEGRKSGYIAEDGRTSVEEDYANNLEHFLYSPDKLKKVTPEAYNWFNKAYKDLKLKERKK